MTFLNDPPFSQLQFYVTAPYGCSYLPNRIARSQIVTPNHLVDQFTYSELIRAGFRRSGVFTYRPHCESCNECVAVRLPVARYEPNRSQRKTLKRHDNLVAIQRPLTFREEHYALYQRYQISRHSGGGMDQDSRNQYAQFLLQSQVDSHLIEFREGEKGPLRMVSIIDLLTDGLSSVYTFYDPDIPGASLGTYGIIWQIAQCSHLGLPYLYLGYLIRNSRKMSYKANFRPLEKLDGLEWRPFDPDPDMNATPEERHA